ncbi:MAG: hypothetical protein ACOCUW_02545 [Gemmatimonadota bacterium]
MVRTLLSAVSVSAAIILAGCGDDDPAGPVGNVPEPVIEAPADGSVYDEGDTVTFEGAATDVEDGDLPGSALEWSSSIDGELGDGATLEVPELSVGDHEIALTALDSDGNIGTTSIAVIVRAVPGRVIGR